MLSNNLDLAKTISENAGLTIQHESRKWIQNFGELPIGACAIISPGMIRNTKYLVPTIGPNYRGAMSTDSKKRDD